MIHTIETRLKLNETQEALVDSCVVLWSTYYRKTWKLWNNQQLKETEIYHELMNLNLFTSRQVGSLINKVKTEHAKIKELSKTQLKQQKAKLLNITKFIAVEEKNISKLLDEISNLKVKLKNYHNTNKAILKEPKNKIHERINKLTHSIKKKNLVLFNKKIKLNRLKRSIHILEQRIKFNKFKLCFGSSQLLKQRPGSFSDQFRLTQEQNKYKNKDLNVNLAAWEKDWDLARNNIWISIGDKNKPQGNAEIQYDHINKILKLRLTEQTANERLREISKNINIPYEELNNNINHKYSHYRMQARFMEINNVEFCSKNQVKIQQAIANQQPITAKIIKKLTPGGKNIGYYLQLSFEEVLSIHQNKMNKSNNFTMGIDLNEKGLAYCIIKADGNKLSPRDQKQNSLQYKPCGFIQWDLKDKTTAQRQWVISNKITEILAIAEDYNIKDIAIENLDFSSNMGNMNAGYKGKTNDKGFNYNKMLSSFAKKQFSDMITRKTERLGMNLYLVNPAYSSIGGFSKYGVVNKLPVDMAASLWLARQSLYGEVYKEEVRNNINNISYIRYVKKHKEAVVFPYDNLSKQSKREINHKKEWNTIALALGKNRNSWYKNFINYINNKTMNEGVNPKVGKTLLLPKELFSSDNEYDPFAINPS